MRETIFLISGLTDIETVGNQSFKNNIKYLSEFGYRVHAFTFMPEDYPNLQDPKAIFGDCVVFHRLPWPLSSLLNLGKRTKDVIGRRGGTPEQSNVVPDKAVGTYLKEYNPLGRIFYLVFLFILYLPIELLRTLYFSLKCKPNLIYGVNCQGTVVASLLGKLLGKPVITRYFGVCISESDVVKLSSRMFVLDEIAGLVANTTATVMTNDGTGGDKILKLLQVDERKINFWMNGFDAEHLRLPGNWDALGFKRDLGVENKKVIMMISRLATWKRVDRGINCVHKLVKEHGMKNIVLLIAGEGPARADLQTLAESLGVSDVVRFLGGVPHKELCKFLSISDVFLNLFDVSNLGNPLLEALYFNVPVVTIDDKSMAGLLENNVDALLVKIENLEEELPLQVKRILEEESLREAIRRNAKSTFEKKVLSWEERMRLEDKLIQDILCEVGRR